MSNLTCIVPAAPSPLRVFMFLWIPVLFGHCSCVNPGSGHKNRAWCLVFDKDRFVGIPLIRKPSAESKESNRPVSWEPDLAGIEWQPMSELREFTCQNAVTTVAIVRTDPRLLSLEALRAPLDMLWKRGILYIVVDHSVQDEVAVDFYRSVMKRVTERLEAQGKLEDSCSAT